MKKKVASLAMATVMLVGLMAGFGLSASAASAVYYPVNATAVDSETLNTTLADHIRDNASAAQKLREPTANALGKADAVQNGGDNKFTGLRYYDEVTYSFHDIQGGQKRLIANHPESAQPDLSLIEVTWGTGWHVEAVDVYLVGAVTVTTVEGDTVYSPPSETPLKIGTAFNKVGIEKGYAARENTGMVCTFSQEGNFGYTNIFFPDNIAFASAVQLKDATTRYNEPIATSTWYKSSDEGFDLDALTAWYTITGGSLETTFGFGKMVDYDGDGEGDWNGEAFIFDLYMSDGAGGWKIIATKDSDDLGQVVFYNLVTGSYKVVEQNAEGYTLTNFVDGLRFNVVGDEIEYVNWDPSEGDAVFLNAYTPDWASDTSWAGYVTNNKTFPMHNKSKFAELNGVKRSGQTNWAMVLMYDGDTSTADIVMGQHSDIGDISVDYEDGKFVVSGVVALPDCKVTHVHADASASLNRFTSAKGNGNFVVNQAVEMAEDGSFSFEIPYDYTDGLAYVGIHMESARDLNYGLIADKLAA